MILCIQQGALKLFYYYFFLIIREVTTYNYTRIIIIIIIIIIQRNLLLLQWKPILCTTLNQQSVLFLFDAFKCLSQLIFKVKFVIGNVVQTTFDVRC